MSTIREQMKADAMLTTQALKKITGAMARGTLSERLHVNRYPTQIVIQNLTEADERWFKKTFGVGVDTVHTGATKRRGGRGRSEVVDTIMRTHHLREEGDPTRYYRDAPRIEIWGLYGKHEHRHFKGEALKAVDGSLRVFWRCGDYGCKKRITKAAALKLGLYQPRDEA